MRWKEGRRSKNVEDRRGRRIASGGLKIGGGLGLLILLAILLLGGDPTQFLAALLGDAEGGAGDAAPVGEVRSGTAAEDELADLTTRVLAMTEDSWGELLAESGRSYRPPVLVMFTDRVRSACGLGSAATGPFYCPADEKIYIDLGFFRDLARMAGIDSREFDFAAAYVIAHEVGHHVQNLLGISDEVRQAQARSPGEANALSVAMELQADCLAGVWANHTRLDGRPILEPGDVSEGLRAAAAIGDDRLMREAGGAVSPESFTHGSSDERRQWLSRGLERGEVDSCDTFAQRGYR